GETSAASMTARVVTPRALSAYPVNDIRSSSSPRAVATRHGAPTDRPPGRPSPQYAWTRHRDRRPAAARPSAPRHAADAAPAQSGSPRRIAARAELTHAVIPAASHAGAATGTADDDLGTTARRRSGLGTAPEQVRPEHPQRDLAVGVAQ